MKKHSITIAWDPSPPPTIGYNVYRGLVVGGEGNIPINDDLVVGTQYKDETVQAGQAYSYAITSVWKCPESIKSNGVLSTIVPADDDSGNGDDDGDGDDGGNSASIIDLGVAGTFAILAATTIENVSGSNTAITGDIGVSPGSAIIGLETPAVITGEQHPGDNAAEDAQAAVEKAFAEGMALPGTDLGPDLGSQCLTPGVYSAHGTVGISGTLTLDAQGDQNASWVFKINSTLTTADTDSKVELVNGALAANVFWLVDGAVSLGAFSSFVGTIIANGAIIANTQASINGRLFSKTEAVKLDGSHCEIPEMPPDDDGNDDDDGSGDGDSGDNEYPPSSGPVPPTNVRVVEVI